MSNSPNDSLLDLYERFLAYRREITPFGIIMPYDWYSFSESINIAWLSYREMLREFAAELANTINALTLNVRRLQAWSVLLPELRPQEILEVKIEFLDTLATVALGSPYAIKSHFAWAAANLCHQANRVSGDDWVDDFTVKDALYLNDVDIYGKNWRRFRRFKPLVERIGGTDFRTRSNDFRNAYNHRSAPALVLGLSGIVSREIGDDGSTYYGFGGRPPLSPGEIVVLLQAECEACYAAFGAFRSLVDDQIATIFREPPKVGCP